MRRLLLPLLAVIVALLAGPAAARPAVWIVRDADSVILLFGSVHLLPADLDWRPPELDQALAKADDIWFETPMDPVSQAKVARLAQARGYLPKGRSLAAMLAAPERERLTRQVAGLSLWAPDVDRMEPWMADTTLTVAALSRRGAGGSGVERQLEQSTPAKVRRRAFESGSRQVDLFHRAAMSDQLAMLKQSLAELDDEPDAYRALLAAWMAGDQKMLRAYGVDRLRAASPTLYRRLLSERNARWTRIILQRLAGHGATVMVVGAGHLVGPDGLPARLRALGVAVEGPKDDDP